MESYNDTLLGLYVPDDWNLILSWGIKNLQGRSFRASICKVAWWATVYHTTIYIWIQRNDRIHAGGET